MNTLITFKNQKGEAHIHPFIQAGFVMIIFLVFVGIGTLLEIIGLSSKDEIFPWIVAASMLLFYAIFNCVFSLNADNSNQYWLHSLIGFSAIAAGAGLLAYLFTGISIYEAKSIQWIYFVFTFAYLVFLSIVNFMRLIVRFAKKQDHRLRGEKKNNIKT